MNQCTSNNLIIREARSADKEALVNIENQTFNYDQLSRRQINYLMHSKTAHVVVAEYQGQAIGFLIGLFRARSRIGRIYSVAVLSAWRKRGVARQLLHYFEEKNADRFSVLQLEVKESNQPALLFYLHQGFYSASRRPNYYTDGEAAVVMKKQIK